MSSVLGRHRSLETSVIFSSLCFPPSPALSFVCRCFDPFQNPFFILGVAKRARACLGRARAHLLRGTPVRTSKRSWRACGRANKFSCAATIHRNCLGILSAFVRNSSTLAYFASGGVPTVSVCTAVTCATGHVRFICWGIVEQVEPRAVHEAAEEGGHLAAAWPILAAARWWGCAIRGAPYSIWVIL